VKDELLEGRTYPQLWLLVDVADREQPRLVGHEIVDLSPSAIELRSTATRLQGYAEQRERWRSVGPGPMLDRLGTEHRHQLSFGPDVAYCVEHDETRDIHEGRPFRHLMVRFSSRILTPATSAEIGLYFYGRRPAIFGYTDSNVAHGYIGLDWEKLEDADAERLLRREMHFSA
jgi:hypothetical protein